ncbi:MAG: CRTAC1 family protein [Acidobacteria bacterium]|nr:MAG: CRTAC1 family protein [Acidobacteriota bacterium]
MITRIRAASLLLSVICWAGVGPVSLAATDSPLLFVDVAAEAGLEAPTWCGGLEKPHLLESGGTGLALFDYDVDGDLDLFLVNGWRLDRTEIAERGRNLLYRNEGDGLFRDVTERAGVGDDQWGTGVTTGDLDGDRLPDLFVTSFGTDILYRNQGDGTFVPVAESPSVEGWSTGAVFFDSDADGDQDLFVAGYVDATLEEVLFAEPTLVWEGLNVMVGPFGLDGLGNHFFRNLGDGRFEDVTKESGLEDVGLFYSFAVSALDLDGDRDLDLYVTNDSNPNYLYRNNGAGVFEEVGLWSGAALDGMGNAQAGMGMAAGDLDNDGLPDLFVSNFWKDVSTFYRNLGDFIFEDATLELGLRQSTYLPLSWGTTLSDLDHDGGLEIFIANGHIFPQADQAPPSSQTSFRQANVLLLNEGGRFVDVSDRSGPGLEVVESSRGLAVGDIDFDGDLDLAVSNVDAPPTLLRNDSERRGSWLMIDAPEALRVTVETGSRQLIRHRVIAASYVSVNDERFHLGLGKTDRVPKLTLLWPDGSQKVLTDVGVDRVLVFRR